jgi:hypothetical protein
MSIDWQQTTKHLNDLGVLDVEIRDDTDGPYLSIPVGYAEAVEVEEETTSKTMPSGRVVEETVVFVTFRRWDQTHGLDDEVALASVHQIAPPMIAAVVHGLVAEYERQYASIERDMQESMASLDMADALRDMQADEQAQQGTPGDQFYRHQRQVNAVCTQSGTTVHEMASDGTCRFCHRPLALGAL